MARHRPIRATLALLLALTLALTALPLAPVARAAACAVTSAADSGPGTLRAALANSDNFAALGGGCTAITFDVAAMGGGTIILASRLPLIARDLTIAGPGVGGLTIQGTSPAPDAFPL